MVSLAHDFFAGLGLRDVTLKLHSMGDGVCQPGYVALLGAFLAERADQLCPAHRARHLENPLRVLDCKTPECRAATEDAPRFLDHLCDPCAAHFARVRAGLESLGVDFTIDHRLVRGFDYYTRTTFEFAAEALDAAQNGIGGGGRYDGLVELLGGGPTPGIGFGIGIERVLLACDAEGVFSTADVVAARPLHAYVIDTAGGETAVILTAELRRAGLRAERAFGGRSMKSQIKSADRSGALAALVVGDQELAEGTVGLRPLRSNEEQRTVPRAAIVDELKSFLANAAFAEGSGGDVDRHLHPHLRPTTSTEDDTRTTRPTMTETNRPTAMRTHLCGVLRKADVGTTVRLCGWVARRREHGEHLAFVDLRDHTGIVQCVIDHATDVRHEWVIAVTGTVRERPEGTVNPGIGTGEIEIGDCTVEVLNEAEPPPFSVDDRAESDEPVRLRYRYVDLRRPRLQRNLRLRSRVNAAIRAAMVRQGFVEIETPLLWAPTPEGSREFSVPSRLHHGSFYALPQSPQLAKQLLMVGGFDRYFQIARCLRDEDLRADRQFEFSQLDMECSFASQDDVMAFVSEAVLDAAEAATGERPPPIERITWADARDRFGTDKPDLRFGMELVDLTAVFEDTEVKAFSAAHGQGRRGPRRRHLSALTARRADRTGEEGGSRRAGLVPRGRERPVARGAPGAPPVGAGAGGRPAGRRGRRRGTSSWSSPDTYTTACAVLGTLRVAIGAPPGGPGPAPIRVGRRLPDVRGHRRRRQSAGGPPPVHHAVCRGPAAAGVGPAGGALAGLRPRAQRVGARVGQCAYPSPGDPVAGVRGARDRTRGGRGPLRVPAGRLPLRGAAARRLRVRRGPAGRDPGRRGEHPRGHRVPQDPVRRRPAHRRPDAAPAHPARRAGHPGRRAAARAAAIELEGATTTGTTTRPPP